MKKEVNNILPTLTKVCMKKEVNNILPTHIANYFLWRSKKEGVKDMTPIKLIKLIYFAYAWHLAIFKKTAFCEKIEAWKYGPVIPSIYYEFKKYGKGVIKQFATQDDLETGKVSYPVIDDSTDKNIVNVVDAIWRYYKDYDGWYLSSITHETNSPWNFAYAQGENTNMDNDKIIERAKEAILKYRDS